MAIKPTGSSNAKPEGLPPPLGGASHQDPQSQLSWVLAACARVLRPVVRLALSLGAKHAQLETLLRELMIDEARRAWRLQGIEPNISQLSVTTGLNRKAVTLRVRETPDPLSHSETSAGAKTLTMWLQMFADDPAYRFLPIATEGGGPSFESLARRASRGNVHHRAILDELVRLNMVAEVDGRAELAAAGFVPSGDLKEMLAFLGDNTRDHLLAAVSNTLGASAPLLERSVFAGGIRLEDCERIHQLARERWGVLHRALTEEMTRSYEAADEGATGRIRVGIYTYYEDTAAEAAASAAKAKGSKA